MLIYIGLILCGFLLCLLKGNRKYIAYRFFISSLIFILCFGYTTGSDWRNYEMVYTKLDITDIWSNMVFEPGYMLYMCFFKILDVDFWVFWCFTKCLLFVGLIYFLHKNNFNHKLFVLTFWLGLFGYYLFIDNPMRMLIAMTLFLFAITKYLNGGRVSSIVFIILAISFHITAIVLPLYIKFLTRKIPKIIWISLFFVFNFLLASKDLLYYIANFLFGQIPYLQAKIYAYFIDVDADTKFLSVGFIVNAIFFVLLLYKYDNVLGSRFKLFSYNATILFICIYRLTLCLDIMARFQYYLYIFYIIGLLILYDKVKTNSKIVLGTIYIVMAFYFSFSKITKGSRYIPYTNYIVFSLFEDDLTYDERLIYNETHSPYEEIE